MTMVVITGTVFTVVAGARTYSNVLDETGQVASALGAMAGSTGVAFSLAVLMIAMNTLGHHFPLVIRIGLWLTPLVAAALNGVIANGTEAVIAASNLFVLCVATEGTALVVRIVRVVPHQDSERTRT
ncbi:MAG: hypothetical protein IJI97_06780 [Clostridia bacterium]|nr:hypothetical protein [Clostridia bacterium]